jgi:hypothetical protein
MNLNSDNFATKAERGKGHVSFHWPSALAMNRPGHPIVAWRGKAALKTHALQTLRDCRASPNRAKRLECVRFIGAFRLAMDGQRFMVPMHAEKTKRGLSMNQPTPNPSQEGNRRSSASSQFPSWEGLGGSWSQCMRKSEWTLSMNLGWFGVPPSGGSSGLDRLKPGLQAVSGFIVPMHGHKSWRLSMRRSLPSDQPN